MLAMDEPGEEGGVLIIGVRGDEQHARADAQAVHEPAERGGAALLGVSGARRPQEKHEDPDPPRRPHPRPASFFARADPAPVSRPPLAGASTSVTIRACCSAWAV